MSKREIVDKVVSIVGSDLTKKAVGQVFDTIFEQIQAEIQKSGRVWIPNFGTFRKRVLAARTVVNPKTRAKMQVGERTSVGFRPAKAAKAAKKSTKSSGKTKSSKKSK